METRARRAVCERASALPQEVWQLIVSFLTPSEAIRAALVCSDFAAVSTSAAQEACRRLWPQHAQRLAAYGTKRVQRFLQLVQAHEEEEAAHPDVANARTVQKTVCPEHRQIAVEWLIEVSWDWQLESTVVYRGTQYLDHYLATHAVPALSKFQMLAISCLRTALKHSSKLAERERQRLPCKHWAEVTDGACSEAEVRNTCSKLERMLQQQQRSHPNAKQRLRYLWYRLYDAGTVEQQHVYVYMLASFMLHLSLLDSALSAVTPTKLATAALSLSLKVFGFLDMPPVLAEHCFYLQHELEEVQLQLARAQEDVLGQQLRALWMQSYSYIGANPSQQPAYTLLQQVVSEQGKLQHLPSSKGASSPCAASEGAVEAALVVTPSNSALTAATAGHAPATGHGINRVLTRAAAAAGMASTQRQQHTPAAVPPAPAFAAAATSTWDQAQPSRNAGASSSQAASARSHVGVAHAVDAEQGNLLVTPQRPAAVSAFLQGLAPAATPTFNVPAAATATAAGAQSSASAPTPAVPKASVEPHPGADTGSHSGAPQLAVAGGSSSARRCATRELPPRRAVAVSRYGMLASRSSTGTPVGATAAASHNFGGPKGTGGGHLGSGDAASWSLQQHQRIGASSSGAFAGAAAAAGTPPVEAASTAPLAAHPASAAGGVPCAPHSRARLATAAPHMPPGGSVTPASPKHAAAGTRGLAALFAGVGHQTAGNSSHAGSSSNTGRLLSGLPSLQSKPYITEPSDLQERQYAHEAQPAWLWPVLPTQQEMLSFDAAFSSAGASSSSASLHLASLPGARSTRRAAAAAAAGAAGSSSSDPLQKLQDRPGVHTRSSSSFGSSEGTNSHWHAVTSTGARGVNQPHYD